MTGSELREIRKSMNLSQKQFAESLGVKLRTMTNLEKSEDIGTLYNNAVSYLLIKSKQPDSLKGKKFNKTCPFTDEVLDVFEEFEVVDEKVKPDGSHVVLFDNGKGARVIDGLPLNYVESA